MGGSDLLFVNEEFLILTPIMFSPRMSGNAEVSSSVMERKCGATIVTQKIKDLF